MPVTARNPGLVGYDPTTVFSQFYRSNARETYRDEALVECMMPNNLRVCSPYDALSVLLQEAAMIDAALLVR